MKRKVTKKKRKWKKGAKLTLIFLGILVICLIGLFLFGEEKLHKSKSENLPHESFKEEDTDYIREILPFENPDMKADFLAWIEENYPNALKEILKALKENRYERSLWHKITGNSYFVLQDLYQDSYEENPRVQIVEGKKEEITISFAGDVNLADDWFIMPYYLSRKKGIYGIFSEDMVNYMKNSDLMIVNSEFSFSNRGTPIPKKTYTFRANPKYVSLYDEMGVDMVTLANNHVYDFGKDAFLDTLSTLEKANVPYVGAGRNLKEAKEPYYFIINGYKIAFVDATRAEKFILTPEATENSPGVFRAYDPNPFAELIKKTKENSDYVVALIHWGKENFHTLEDVQMTTGKLYIDSGADLIVGTHAHELQGVEFYKDKLIAYNLGDFIFNAQTKNTGVLTWKLHFDGSSEYFFAPALESDRKTSLIYEEDALKLYKKMTSWSVNGEFQADGRIVEEKA